MQDLSRLTETGHAIQLAVAPVFLLSGVSAMLAVLTNRLARIIDRGRLVEAELPRAVPETAPAMRHELAVLARRARLINWAISLCTVCALLVCAVIVALFLGPFLRLDRGDDRTLQRTGELSAGDLRGHPASPDRRTLTIGRLRSQR